MGALNSIKNFLGFESEEELDEELYEREQMDDEDEDSRYSSKYSSSRSSSRNQYSRQSPKIVNVKRDGRGSDYVGDDYPTSTIKVYKPKSINDTRKIADDMLRGIVIIMDIENADAAERQRIVDCIYGVSYGLRYNFRRVADRMFVSAPHNIDISGDGIKTQDGEIYHW